MSDSPTHCLSQAENGFFVQGIKKWHLKQVLIAFLDVLRVNVLWQTLEHLFVLIELEGFLDLVRLFDEVTNLCLQFFSDFIFLTHLMKIFEFFLFFFIISFHLTDD